MTAFPVMNPAAPLAGKHALIQKLMAQYQRRGTGHGHGGMAPGVGGGMPFRGGALTHLNIRGSSNVNGNSRLNNGFLPMGMGVGDPGSGWADESAPINQSPSYLDGGYGAGAPGFGGDGSGGGTGGTGGMSAPVAPTYTPYSPGVSQAGPTIPGTTILDPSVTGDVDPGFNVYNPALSNLGGGATYNPLTGKIIPGVLEGPGSGAQPFLKGSSTMFFS